MSEPKSAIVVRIDSFTFPGKLEPILEGIEFEVGLHERVAVMGPSGAGKTTLLKICAGLKAYRPQNGICERSGRFSMLFQDNVLLDHLTVADNIALPSKIAGKTVDIEKIARRFHIHSLLDVYPLRLSGGERKRVALARAMAYPDLHGIIGDEAFVAMDIFLREEILVDLKKRLDEACIAGLFATHSPEEAVFLADRVIVLGGRPATIVNSTVIDLPRERGVEVFESKAFHSTTAELALLLRSTFPICSL